MRAQRTHKYAPTQQQQRHVLPVLCPGDACTQARASAPNVCFQMARPTLQQTQRHGKGLTWYPAACCFVARCARDDRGGGEVAAAVAAKVLQERHPQSRTLVFSGLGTAEQPPAHPTSHEYTRNRICLEGHPLSQSHTYERLQRKFDHFFPG